MKLHNITLTHYRNFDEYTVSLGHKVTVFIGRNGMGKTNIIEAMVQSLSFIFSKQRDTMQYEFIRSTDQGVKPFKSTDPIFDGDDYLYPVSLSAIGAITHEGHNTPLSWAFEQESKKSGLKDSKFREAYHAFWNHYITIQEKPVLAFFSDGFPHKNTNLSIGMKDKLNSGNPLPPSDGYYQWDKEQSCVNIWKKYFVQQWLNNRLNPDENKEAFVQAINDKLVEFSHPINGDYIDSTNIITTLYAEYREDQANLMIEFANGSKKPFDTLPAGYERIYSMVLDLASRSYLLNHHTNPEGIVFIDEIDLHLHPSLETEILSRLQRSFPRIQFIVTTHSPMVISNFDQTNVPNDDYRLINLLRNDDGYFNQEIKNIFGLDYNSSLEKMGTRLLQKFNDELAQAYRYWNERDQAKAQRIAELLKGKYASDSDIIKTLGF